MGLFLGDSGFPLNIAAIGAVVMAHEKTHVVRQGQHLLDAVIKRARVTTGEIGTCRPAVGHKERVTDKTSVTDDMHHAGRRMPRRGNDKGLHIPDLIGVAFFEQSIKLRSVALEFRACVKDLAKGVLHNCDLFTDTDLATQLFLNIGGCAQVVGVHMSLDDPVQL